MQPRAGVSEHPVTLPDGTEPDPYPAYALLRDAGAVHVVEEPTGLRRWTFLRYRDARRALADPRLSKNPRNAWDELLRTGYATGDPETDQYMFHLLNSDPPDHTRLRGLVLKTITAGRVDALRPRIQRITDDLLDGIDPHRPADLHTKFALPLAVTVIGELLGVPTDDFDDYHLWATVALMPPGASGAPMPRADAYLLMKAFLTDLMALRRQELAGHDQTESMPDLLSALITARDNEDALSEQELVALTMFLLNTGQDPTVNMITNGALALLDHPDQLALLCRRPELLPSAIEEFLRFDGPVALSTMRIAIEDIAVGEAVIPKGAIVSIVMNSADHDPRRFADPDRLDVTRAHNSHLAFGHGIHRCPGMPLARSIGEVAFGTLLRRFPRLGLACGRDELRWRSARVMRGLLALPVILSPT